MKIHVAILEAVTAVRWKVSSSECYNTSTVNRYRHLGGNVLTFQGKTVKNTLFF